MSSLSTLSGRPLGLADELSLLFSLGCACARSLKIGRITATGRCLKADLWEPSSLRSVVMRACIWQRRSAHLKQEILCLLRKGDSMKIVRGAIAEHFLARDVNSRSSITDCAENSEHMFMLDVTDVSRLETFPRLTLGHAGQPMNMACCLLVATATFTA